MTNNWNTTVWLTPSDGKRWRFDPGSLSLAFAYSGDFGYNIDAWETLREPSDLDAWLTGRFGPALRPSHDTEYLDARHLRAAIAAVARRIASGDKLDPAAVDTINDWAGRPSAQHYLAGGTREPEPPSPARLIATIAQDAVRSFAPNTGTIRECAADDCRLIFLDSSRPQNRRWCSMNRCGGRAKARTHYAQHRTGEPS